MKKDIIIKSILALAIVVLAALLIADIWGVLPIGKKSREQEIEKLKTEIHKRDSITLILYDKITVLKTNYSELQEQNDSLIKVKQTVIIKYHEIYNNINSASNKQLDSIIRANW